MQCHTIPAIICMVAVFLTCGCFGFQTKSQNDQAPLAAPPTVTTVAAPVTTPTTIETTATPAPTQESFPNAFKLKQVFQFGENKTRSEGTVYRYWINDTFQLFDPRETVYVTKTPSAGNKYLIIFVNAVNRGSARTWAPKSSGVSVIYNNQFYYPDPTHSLPRTEKTADGSPVILRIREIEIFHKLYGSEYVEDFGYSHGMELAYLTPGESNAIDGYVVFEVPAALTPDKTYVEIAFNSQDSAVWKLA